MLLRNQKQLIRQKIKKNQKQLIRQKIMTNQGSMVIKGVNDIVMEIFEVTGFVNILEFE